MSREKKLRVAGYCRTSSETQRDNTSIPIQKTAIERFTEANGWEFVSHYVDECKSGSKIEGREDFQRMMRDAANGCFEVIVVFDTKRFGRDGVDILESARTLKRAFSVDVVDTKGGFDTRDRRRNIVNFVQAGVAEDERISILERTRGGKKKKIADGYNGPLGAQRPFGRVWDKQTQTWYVDEAAKERIENVARRYLAGESIVALAKEYGINHASLHTTLKDRCGETWTQHVRCKELGIDEEVQTKVPRLLPEETIQAIRDRMEVNRTWSHGRAKRTYLLSRFVFCSGCGQALTAQATPDGRRYYRHFGRQKCKIGMWVNAELIEESVFRNLFYLFGNPDALRRAIEAAVPNREKVAELQQRQEHVAGELERLKTAKERIVRFVAKGTITEEETEKEMANLREREVSLQQEQKKLQVELAGVPTAEDVEVSAKRYLAVNRVKRYDKMTTPEKRSLAELVFGGKTAQGRRQGVYVAWTDSEQSRSKKHWNYRILGCLVDEQSSTASGPSYAVDDWHEGVRQDELSAVSKSASHLRGRLTYCTPIPFTVNTNTSETTEA